MTVLIILLSTGFLENDDVKNTLALHWYERESYELQENNTGQGHPMRRKATVYSEHTIVK